MLLCGVFYGEKFTIVKTGKNYQLISKERIETDCYKYKVRDLDLGVETYLTFFSRELVEVTMPAQNWYFTFGSGQPNRNKYHVIYGTHEEANKQMMKRFGKKWAMQYSEVEFAGQTELYGLEELKQ